MPNNNQNLTARTWENIKTLYKPAKYTLGQEIHIIHLHDTGRRCIDEDNGFKDARHMQVTAFNTDKNEMYNLGIHDGMIAYSEGVLINMIRIFEDGSTFLRFETPVHFSYLSQELVLKQK